MMMMMMMMMMVMMMMMMMMMMRMRMRMRIAKSTYQLLLLGWKPNVMHVELVLNHMVLNRRVKREFSTSATRRPRERRYHCCPQSHVASLAQANAVECSYLRP